MLEEMEMQKWQLEGLENRFWWYSFHRK